MPLFKDILKLLGQDPEDSIRMRIALNPKTPPIVLEQLLNDKWAEVVEVYLLFKQLKSKFATS
jgi:hypothetical protein